MQKNTRYSFRRCVLRTLVQPTSEPVDQGLAHRPAPLHGQDVGADLLRDLIAQCAQPLAHGLMANVGAIESAPEPRTLARAAGHEVECTYLGTDVNRIRGRIRLHNVSTTGVDFRGSGRTRVNSPAPEKPSAVRDFAGKRVRRRGLVSLKFTCSDPVSPTNNEFSQLM